MLTKEIKYFEANLKRWLTEKKGLFVLIKGEELIGTFNTFEAALAEGAQRYGLESFLIRPVQESPEEIHIPALTLGILVTSTPPTN